MTKMRKQTSKSLPCKQGRKQRKFKPFDKEFQPPVVSDYSAIQKVAAFVPKGEIPFLVLFLIWWISGNPYTRDLAEDFPSDFDKNSAVVRYETTHTRKNHKEFSNVTESLRDTRNYDSKRRRKGVKPDHSLERKVAKPLGRRKAIQQSASVVEQKTKKESKNDELNEEAKNEACKKRAVKILLEKSMKEPKPEIKVEMPVKIPGFMPLDIIKGNVDNNGLL